MKCDNNNHKISAYNFINNSWNCPYCEIDRLKVELEEAKQDISKYTLMFAERDNEAFDLERQLAEARAENEKIGSVLGLQEYTKHIRQEAARTVERYLLGMFWYIPNKENEPMIYRDQAIEWLRRTFGLEG